MAQKLIEDILVERDRISRKEAIDLVKQAREDLISRLADGEMPYNICEEWFGLEPDYLDH